MIGEDLFLVSILIILAVVIIMALYEISKQVRTPPLEIPQPPPSEAAATIEDILRKVRAAKIERNRRIVRDEIVRGIPMSAETRTSRPLDERFIRATVVTNVAVGDILTNLANWALDETIIITDPTSEENNIPGTIRSDPQNTHDTQVNRIIKKNLETLSQLYDRNNAVDQAIDYYSARRKYTRDEELLPIDGQMVRKKLADYHEIKDPVIYFGYTPDQALNLAWQRADDRKNRENSSNIKEAILAAVLDPKHICSHGKLSSVIGALDGTDIMGGLEPIVSKQITKYMVSDTAGVKYRELLKEISGNTNLDNRMRCAALDSDESYPGLDCWSLTDEEKIKGIDALKHRIRPRLHLELEKIYGGEYAQFKNDIDIMIDMM